MRALLGEGNVVEEDDAPRAGKRPGQMGAVATQDGLFVPGALADELLERLLGVGAGQAVGQGDAAGEGLDALAFAVEEESLEVDAGPASRLGRGEVVGEQRRGVAEAVEDRRVKVGGVRLHARLEFGTGSEGPGL